MLYFFFSFRYLFQKDIVFYLNTIMPVGAAVAAKLSGKKIVYHYHENASAKSRFYVFWLGLCRNLRMKLFVFRITSVSFAKKECCNDNSEQSSSFF